MRTGIVAVAVAALASTMTLVPRVGEAQTMPPPGRISASPQGLIGGALLGGELVIMIEGAAGVRNPWILLGSGAAGMIAGGVGGFFLDQALDAPGTGQTQTAISTGMLVVGLGLVIPTAIVYASATMYRPEDAASTVEETPTAPLEESGGTGASPAGASDGSAPTSGTNGGNQSARSRSIPMALMEYAPTGLRLGWPTPALVRSYSLEEMRQFGLAPMTEWRVPLLSAVF